MNRKIIFVLIAGVLFLPACEQKTVWNPIFEETSFRYLDNSMDQVLHEIRSAKESLKPETNSEGFESLNKAEHICLNLKQYYIPLTNVRQMVYDADRFFYLKKIDETRKRLEETRVIVEKIDRDLEEASIEPSLEALISMIDDCILTLDNNQSDFFDKIEKLGHKVNLMLIKGNLIIS